MRTIYEGTKENIEFEVKRNRGTGAINVTGQQFRILNAAGVLIAGFDWASASFNSDTNVIHALFDSTAVGLTAVGNYHMQFRWTIGVELYEHQVRVVVQEWGS
jgi:ABC-type uncharacterized transport system permease subunit